MDPVYSTLKHTAGHWHRFNSIGNGVSAGIDAWTGLAYLGLVPESLRTRDGVLALVGIGMYIL